MSGLAGFIHFDQSPAAASLLAGMTAAMAVRGPDGIHHTVSGAAALGHCLLRVTAECDDDRQPLANDDGTVIVLLDGRFDNYHDLRRTLQADGVLPRSRADSELLLQAYLHWGRDCLPKLEGSFALVVWDARQQSLWCVRDRMGNRPFHYHWNGRTFSFATDLHALLTLPWVTVSVNEGKLAECLTDTFLTTDQTLWRDVWRLKPAHEAVVDGSGLQLRHYWQPALDRDPGCRTPAEYAESYRELLQTILRRQTRSNRPVAFEVSGGLDSSALYALAWQGQRKGNLQFAGIKGYTVGVEVPVDASELVYARAVGAHCGAPVTEVPPWQPPLQWYLQESQRSRQFTCHPNSALAEPLRASAAADGCRLIVSGDFGDQWLGGSRNYYSQTLRDGDWRELWLCLRRDARTAGTAAALYWFLRHGLAAQLPRAWRRWLQDARQRRSSGVAHFASVLTPALRGALQRQREQQGSAATLEGRTEGQRRQLSFLQSELFMSGTEAAERRYASAGLEVCYPYGDPLLVEFMLAVPEQLRMQGRQDRVLHRQALRGVLPDLVVDRQTKADFIFALDDLLPQLLEHLRSDESPYFPAWVDQQRWHSLLHDNAGMAPEWRRWVLWNVFALLSCVIGDPRADRRFGREIGKQS